ncbi:MAG: selenocysteine-specific translation elongation factor [Actinomycetota bacterium]
MSEAATRAEAPADAPLHVVATAGHVDHGKSSLIVRLTGIDPDRWEEEKRRGLTIDLGFAWRALPSGREIGFVDVPGHERFVRNMLAGVGPVRLVLFVVAADEGWKPQSEEHLAIVDVLGSEGGVVALTKRDLVDRETLRLTEEDVRDRLVDTALEGAPIVPCSSSTGEGIDELVTELDAMVAGAPPPARDGRPRHFVDRVFTIKGAGTVVTGTLTGGPLAVGQEVELYPTGTRARIRSLQTHKRPIEVARPVSRVAANLVGADRERLDRGDVLGIPGEWRPTREFEARIRPVRGLGHPLTARGAYKLYAGSAERDARIRLYGAPEVAAPAGSFARIRISAPVVIDVFDRFVLREAGRRETVAGGVVLDTDPSRRPGPHPERRLEKRERAGRDELPALLVAERGAARASDVAVLTGTQASDVSGAVRAGPWWVGEHLHRRVGHAVRDGLADFHRDRPLVPGADLATVRAIVAGTLEGTRVAANPSLVDALLDELVGQGEIAQEGSTVRLSSHAVTLAGREEEVDGLVRAVAEGEPSPPTVRHLVAAGFAREVIDAATRTGVLVRVSADLVLTSGFVMRAEAAIREAGGDGITVSAFRERLGTSRKFALPLLEYFDQRRVTVRRGDLRFPRETAPST